MVLPRRAGACNFFGALRERASVSRERAMASRLLAINLAMTL
jgi:hypothetical protein